MSGVIGWFLPGAGTQQNPMGNMESQAKCKSAAEEKLKMQRELLQKKLTDLEQVFEQHHQVALEL